MDFCVLGFQTNMQAWASILVAVPDWSFASFSHYKEGCSNRTMTHTHRHTTWWTPSTVTVTFIGMFIHLFLVLSGDLARLGYSEYSSPQLQIAILSHLLRLSVTWKSNAWPGSEWLTCFELEDSYRIRMPGKVSFQSLCPKKDPKGEDTSKKHLICQSASSSFGRFFKASSAPGTREKQRLQQSNSGAFSARQRAQHDKAADSRPPSWNVPLRWSIAAIARTVRICQLLPVVVVTMWQRWC